jgi:uncharacterized membrane protein
VGIGWVVLCVKVLIPAFRAEHDFLYSLIYAWLGDGPLEMLQTLVLRPGYVAAHILTAEKLGYLLDLFGPLLFLPLLRPDILLIAAPSLLLNLLSLDRIHWSIRYHYQAFIVPFLLIATVYALSPPTQESNHQQPAVLPRLSAFVKRHASTLALLLIVAALASQVMLRSPLISLATRPRDTQRIATAYELMQLVPPDAPLSVTSTLAPHMARRREVYFFPGDDVIYPSERATNGHYIMADLHEVNDQARLRQLQQSDAWRTLAERDDFVVLERTMP